MPRLKDESQEQYLNRTRPYPDTPRPYKVYTALLTQTGTSAPVATVLENTLGFTPTLRRIDVGRYFIDHIGGFPLGKVVAFKETNNIPEIAIRLNFNNNVDGIEFQTSSLAGSSYDLADELLYDSVIEIRIYP